MSGRLREGHGSGPSSLNLTGYGPHATHITVGVSAVDGILVVEIYGNAQRLCRAGRPLQDLTQD